MIKTNWTFLTACIIDDNEFYIAAVADHYNDLLFKQNDLLLWSPDLAVIQGHKDPWAYKTVDWHTVAVTAFMPDYTDNWWLCALSDEGIVSFSGGGKFVKEKIPGAGVWSDDANNWGYLSDLRQIGDCLYACGYCGQVYKRFAPGNWQHIDGGLLQPPGTDMKDSIALSAINGPHENAIYTAGYLHADGLPPKAFFYNGQHWRELTLPDVAERITNIYVESESSIWMCGANGTLLRGNADEGFRSLSSIDDNQLFTGVCKFQEKIYLASNMGLFAHDPQAPEHGIVPVFTDLVPDLQDANVVGCWDKVLWSIGSKDIARFDGKTWQRIHFPDNPRID